mgnify:FL=1
MSFIKVDIADFKAHWTQLLASFPELEDDADLRSDMLEAETELHTLVTRLLRRKLDARVMASAIKERKQEIADRQARFERQEDGYTALLKSLLIAADVDKVTLPDATVSITKPRVVVEITDEAAIPQGFVEIKRIPKKTEIKKALEAGEEIPGAVLGLSDDGIMVRTK